MWVNKIKRRRKNMIIMLKENGLMTDLIDSTILLLLLYSPIWWLLFVQYLNFAPAEYFSVLLGPLVFVQSILILINDFNG